MYLKWGVHPLQDSNKFLKFPVILAAGQPSFSSQPLTPPRFFPILLALGFTLLVAEGDRMSSEDSPQIANLINLERLFFLIFFSFHQSRTRSRARLFLFFFLVFSVLAPASGGMPSLALFLVFSFKRGRFKVVPQIWAFGLLPLFFTNAT